MRVNGWDMWVERVGTLTLFFIFRPPRSLSLSELISFSLHQILSSIIRQKHNKAEVCCRYQRWPHPPNASQSCPEQLPTILTVTSQHCGRMPRKQEDGVCVHALATHTISQQMSMVPRRFPSSLGGSLAGEAVTFLTSGEITCIKEGGPLSLCQQCNEWALRSPRVVTAVGRRCGVPWVALFSFTSSFHLRLPPYYFRFLSEGERLEDFIMYRYGKSVLCLSLLLLLCLTMCTMTLFIHC